MYHRHFPHFHPPQGRTVCARRLAENDVMEYIAKPNMRDDASSPANRVRFVTNFIICNKAKVRRDEGIPPYCAQTNALLFICPSKALGTPSPTLGKAHRPFLLFAPGGFPAGSGDPGPTSHFMVFRPPSNALWGTVLTVPKACKDTAFQNQITSSIPYPTSHRIPIRGIYHKKQPSAFAEGCFK